MEKAFVVRQPIYRGDLTLFAYELLFRNNELNNAAFTNGDQATAQVLLDTFMEIGLDRVVGPNLAFVNVTRNFLLSDYCSLLPKDRLVIQLPGDTIPDAPLLDSVSRFSKEGYLIALDNFRYSEWLRPLLAHIDIVKFDIQAVDKEVIGKQIELLRQFELRLSANNVETQEDFEYCKGLGFDYYQGSFICKPQTVSEDKIPANRMAALRLLAKLQDPKLTTDQLAECVAQDVALSYKLIRYVNSAMHALPREVASIRHAIVLVGTRRISNWAGLILYGQMDDKPSELMTTAIVRARMCQELALSSKQNNAEQFFTVGLFSVLDALLGRSMADALELLPLAQDLKDALVHHQGLLGSALHCVMAYERGDWDQAQCGDITQETIYDCYVNALEWTRRTMQELGLKPDLNAQETVRRRSEAKLKLQQFATEQDQRIKQAEEEARKNVTRVLLARFDLEFQRLSLEFEEKQQQAIASAGEAANMRFKDALAEAERARENLKHDLDSAAQRWEIERQQLQEEKTAAETRVQQVLAEARQELESREQNTMEGFEAERRDLNQKIAKLEAEAASSAILQEEFRDASARWQTERERLESRQPVQASSVSTVSSVNSSEAVTAEIARIGPLLVEISQKIDDPATDLSSQIRLNRELSVMEAYLKGLRYSLGESQLTT
jgi:EAL and modified HD-GYP domain-containing signal transduction protein